jgi:hypothetical protein
VISRRWRFGDSNLDSYKQLWSGAIGDGSSLRRAVGCMWSCLPLVRWCSLIMPAHELRADPVVCVARQV